MLKMLLKKQMKEIFRGFFISPKKNTPRSKLGTIGFVLFFLLLTFGMVGGMMTGMAILLGRPLVLAQMDWLYFILFGGITIVMGVFGSVFSTFSGLYLAKDNDLLLSLPIPTSTILNARMAGVFLTGALYSSIIALPALIVYWCIAGFTVTRFLCCLLWFFGIALFVHILSCVLGWVVAKLSLRLKNKSYVTVLLSLLFLAAYYYLYFNAQTLLRELMQNLTYYGQQIQGKAHLLYLFGRGPAGDWLALLGFLAIVCALFALCWWVLSKTFTKIATATASVSKAVYREKTAKNRGLSGTLLFREYKRFTASPNYMLNCGFGVLFLPLGGVAMLWKGRELIPALTKMLGGFPGAIPVLACAGLCLLMSMNDSAAPSVSLEGKQLWIVQSLPVPAWQALRAKLTLQLLLTLPPLALADLLFLLAIPMQAGELVLFLLVTLLAAVMLALMDLALGVRFANLSWVNEIVPIKQSACVAIALFGGFALGALIGGLYFLFGWKLGSVLYLGLAALVLALGSLGLWLWLRGPGTRRFTDLR